jgi:carbon-monoxide dehydrogenase medium subunit
VKPVRFRYVAPTTVEEAVEALVDAGIAGKALAGGQSLVPMMNFRLARPEVLVDLGRIQTLVGIRVDADVIRLGAMTTHQQVAESTALAETLPLLPEAARHIGHWAIRNRGTVGGSVAHADPAAEWPAVLMALDAHVHVRGREGERAVSLAELVVGPLTVNLAPDEIITRIDVPRPGPDVRWGFYEVARRPGDFALVGTVAKVEAGAVTWTWFGLGGTPVQRRLMGGAPDAVREGLNALCRDLPAESDGHASAGWRRQVAATVAMRAWEKATDQASGEAR